MLASSPPNTNSSPAGSDPSLARFEGAEPRLERVFEPPSGPLLSAIARNKLIVAVCAIVIALAGLAYGSTRPKTYTAAATLQVGQVNPNSPGFYSYVESAAALATAFSRATSAEPVLATIQHKLDLAPAKAVARLSAEPLPLSPAFRVFATGPTEAGAIQLANVAAGAISSYENTSNSSNPEAESLLSEYHRAAIQLERAASNLEHLAYLHRRTAGSPPPISSPLAQAKAERETALAKLAAIRAAYTAAVTSQAPRTGLVSLISGAASATSNHKSKIELLGFVGLLAGVVLGCALAVLRERVRRRRVARTRVEVEPPLDTPHATTSV